MKWAAAVGCDAARVRPSARYAPLPRLRRRACRMRSSTRRRHQEDRRIKTIKCLKVVMGSLLFAAACYAILAAPGFLSDEGSTVSLHRQVAIVQR